MKELMELIASLASILLLVLIYGFDTNERQRKHRIALKNFAIKYTDIFLDLSTGKRKSVLIKGKKDGQYFLLKTTKS